MLNFSYFCSDLNQWFQSNDNRFHSPEAILIHLFHVIDWVEGLFEAEFFRPVRPFSDAETNFVDDAAMDGYDAEVGLTQVGHVDQLLFGYQTKCSPSPDQVV